MISNDKLILPFTFCHLYLYYIFRIKSQFYFLSATQMDHYSKLDVNTP